MLVIILKLSLNTEIKTDRCHSPRGDTKQAEGVCPLKSYQHTGWLSYLGAQQLLRSGLQIQARGDTTLICWRKLIHAAKGILDLLQDLLFLKYIRFKILHYHRKTIFSLSLHFALFPQQPVSEARKKINSPSREKPTIKAQDCHSTTVYTFLQQKSKHNVLPVPGFVIQRKSFQQHRWVKTHQNYCIPTAERSLSHLLFYWKCVWEH